MTISTTTSRAVYAGNGVTTIFSFPYRFLANGDLEVTLFDSVGLPYPQVLTTNYTVTGADADAGGSVTMLVAPAVGQTLVIRRVVDLTQETDYISGDAFSAETHERALDKLTMQDQQLQEQVNRTIRTPLDDTTFDGQLPAIVPGRFLRVNDSGTALELVSVVNTGELVVTPYIETLLDDTNAAAARGTLVVPSRTGADASGTWGISITGNAAGTAANVTGIVAVANGGTGQTTTAGIQSILPIQQTRVDVASASTVNLTTGAASTDHINITGTTTINAFTVAAGRMFFARFSGSLTIASGGSITTQTGGNIITQNGDTCIIRAISANVVEILSYREGRWGSHAGAAPIYGARAWVNFAGTTGAIRASGNVSSVTRNGTGDYTVNLGTAMPDTSFAVVGGGRITAPGYSSVQTDAATAITASAFRVSTVAQSGGSPTAVDCDVVSLAIFR